MCIAICNEWKLWLSMKDIENPLVCLTVGFSVGKCLQWGGGILDKCPISSRWISVLLTRVRNPSVDDWGKLVRYMQYVKWTRKDILTLSADNLHVLKWYVDASFAVHPDFKSHTGAVLTMGEGTLQSMSSKQNLNTRSSCESELVSTDDANTKIFWTKLFMEWQGYIIQRNILFQDNKSTILFIKNGRKSAGKRSRAINIRYFCCCRPTGVRQHTCRILSDKANACQSNDKAIARRRFCLASRMAYGPYEINS